VGPTRRKEGNNPLVHLWVDAEVCQPAAQCSAGDGQRL
jgi:hypothetical protein